MPPFIRPENPNDTIYDDGSKGPNRAGMTPEQRVDNFGGSLLEQSVNKKLESLPPQFDDAMVINPSGDPDAGMVVDPEIDPEDPDVIGGPPDESMAIEHEAPLPRITATPVQYTPTGQPTGERQAATDFDGAYRSEEKQRERDAAMSWLTDGEVGGEARRNQNQGGASVISMIYNNVTKVPGDIAYGVFMEPGAWLAGGVYKALNETVQIVDPIAAWLDKNVPIGPSLGFKDFSKVDPETGKLPETELPNLFGLKDIQPETTTGALLEGITRFLTGFAVGGSLMKTAGVGLGGLLSMGGKAAAPAAGSVLAATELFTRSRYGFAAAKSIFADYAAFDAHEARLADLIQQFPQLQNPVTEFLQSNPNDSQAFGRMKNVVEGLLVDIPMGVVPFMLGLDAVRKVRYQSDIKKLKAQDETFSAAAERLERELADPTTGMPRDIEGKVNGLLGEGAPVENMTIDPVRVKMIERRLGKDTMIDATDPAQIKAMANPGKLNPEIPDMPAGHRRWWYVATPDDKLAKRAGYSDLEDARGVRDLMREAGEKAHIFAYDTPLERSVKGIPVSDLAVPGVKGKGNVAYLDFNPNVDPTKEVFNRQRFNLASISDEADLDTWLQTTSKAMAQEGRLGTKAVPDDKLFETAAEINAWKVVIGESGSLPNAPETMALRQLWASAGRKVTDLADVVARGGDLEAKFALAKAIHIYEMTTRRAKGVAAEQGRALRQWRLLGRTQKELLDQMQEIIESTGGEFKLEMVAQKIAALADNPAALARFMEKSPTMRGFEALREYFINSILSGPHTHMVNAGSNLGVMKFVQLERWLASKIGSVLDPVTGVQMREASVMGYGQLIALREAFANMSMAFRTGRSGYGINKVELPFERAISSKSLGIKEGSAWEPFWNYAGSAINVPVRALGAADEFFKTLNYRAELHAYALRTATQEAHLGKLSGGVELSEVLADGKLFSDFEAKFRSRMAEIIRDPSPDVAEKMADLARYNTFTNKPGPLTQTIIRLRDHHPVASLVIPFINTPANILKFSFDRTPFAALKMVNAEYRAMIMKGGAEANIAMARMGLGTAIMLTAYDLALDGHITGSGPNDYGEKSKLYRGGWQPYSIRVTTGSNRDGTPIYRYYAVNRFEPLGLIISYASDLAELTSGTTTRGADADTLELMGASIFSAIQAIKDKSFLQGFSNMVEAITNPDYRVEGFAGGIIGGLVPAIIAQPNRSIIDPVMRQTSVMYDRALQRIPGMSQQYAPRRDFWGREVSFKSGIGPAYDLLSPIRSRSTENALEIDRELYKIGYSPKHLRSIRVDGKSVPLHNQPEVMDRYVLLKAATPASQLLSENPDLSEAYQDQLSEYGDLNLREYLDALVKGDLLESIDYMELTPEQKKDRISRIIRVYNAAATEQIIREYPVVSEIRGRLPDRTNEESRFY